MVWSVSDRPVRDAATPILARAPSAQVPARGRSAFVPTRAPTSSEDRLVTLNDRRFVARAGAALALDSARYWLSVAPLVRAHLGGFERRARTIPDPRLRALALAKLRTERYNAETAAMLATFVPRAHRADVTEAIVACEVLYDYLDGVSEQPTPDPLRDGHRVLRALVDAVTPDAAAKDYYRHTPHVDDGGYLSALAGAVRSALARLPAAGTVAPALGASAVRCAQAQARVHADLSSGGGAIEAWAIAQAQGTTLAWREYLAGAAASVLAMHALIAAAADPRTTRPQAGAIDAAYLSIGALVTMLDTLIDYERDARAGAQWYLQHYEDRAALARELVGVARRATLEVRGLPHAAHHLMLLVGAVTYFTSAPAGADGQVRALLAPVHEQLRPLTTPTLAYMHAWRAARGLRGRLRGGRTRAGSSGWER
jgi:hypothetical protein